MKLTQRLALGMIAGVTLTALSASAASAASSQRAQPAPAVTRNVKAVLIHPYDGCGPVSTWQDLAAQWSMYGTTRVWMDVKSFCSSAKQVTYAALVASKANVLVFSDTAGGNYQLSAAEIAAITQYVQAGHNILGTFATFMWRTSDNSALAPLFGLTSSFSSETLAVAPDYTIAYPRLALFTAVPSPYDSGGYPRSQRPAMGYWTRAALSGAHYAARTADNQAAITTYGGTADHYKAVYISNMPVIFTPRSSSKT